MEGRAGVRSVEYPNTCPGVRHLNWPAPLSETSTVESVAESLGGSHDESELKRLESLSLPKISDGPALGGGAVRPATQSIFLYQSK